MDVMSQEKSCLPPAQAIRQAILIYLEHAYGPEFPEKTRRFLPEGDFSPEAWLMSDIAERDPADAPLAIIRSFALRIGNFGYPHMKLRLSRPPRDAVFLFSVDAHDAFLSAPAGSPDFAMLEELKRHNATIAAAIMSAWNDAGLPTERNYMKDKIRQAAQDQSNIPAK